MKNRTLRRLKHRLKHAKVRMINDKNSDFKGHANIISEIDNFKYSKLLRRDRRSVYIIYEKQQNEHTSAQVVEVKINTGFVNLWPKEYPAKILNYNKGIMHGYNHSRVEDSYYHVVCTRTTFKAFKLPDRSIMYHSQTDNCIVYKYFFFDKYLVVQLDQLTIDNIDDMEQLPYKIYDVSDNQDLGGYCEYTFIPVVKYGAIVDYIYAVGADGDDQYGYPIQITNKKANRYRHYEDKLAFNRHFVLEFDKFVLLSVSGLPYYLADKHETGIYILNDSLEIISCHTEYVSHEIINMHKLHIGHLTAFMIECSIELRLMAYDGKRLLNIRNIDTSLFNDYWQTKIIDYGRRSEIMWIVNNNGHLRSIASLII